MIYDSFVLHDTILEGMQGRGQLMSLLLIAPHDGTVRWQRGIMNNWPGPLHGTPVSFKLSDTKTEVRSWTGSISFSFFFFFFVASLSISHSFFSLLGNGQEKKKKTHRLTENLASTRMFISLLSLSLALACKKGIQREAETKKRAWQNRSSFSICFLLSASGTKLVLGPRKVSALFC